MKLSWTPDQMPQGPAGAKAAKDKNVKIDPNGPPLLTALPEQLGLKLVSIRGPVDVLVVDRAERPTED